MCTVIHLLFNMVIIFITITSCSYPINRGAHDLNPTMISGNDTKPDWISSDIEIKGYYTGSGFAAKNHSRELQVKNAKKDAYKALIENIRINVKSDYKTEIKLSKTETAEVLSKKTISKQQTSSAMDLYDSTQVDSWQDPYNFELHVLLKVPIDCVTIAIAKSEYDDLKTNPLLTLKDKQRKAGKILKQLREIDCFGCSAILKMERNSLIAELEEFHRDLQNVERQRKTACMVSIAGAFPLNLRKKAAKKLINTFDELSWLLIETDCSEESECISKAREECFEKLILFNFSGEQEIYPRGIFKGMYKVDLSVFSKEIDVIRYKKLSKSPIEKSHDFVFSKKDISWMRLVNKIASRKNMKIQKLIRREI